jgi:acylphosphatase
VSEEKKGIRAVVRGKVQGVFFRDSAVSRAHELGVLGWVRNADDGSVQVHAEGPTAAVDKLVAFLEEGPPAAQVEAIELELAKVEGHEQFAVRGVSAGAFVVQEHWATAHHFDLRLEVDGVLRSWAVPKEPSMNPVDKRLAIEVEDHSLDYGNFAGEIDGGRVEIWDAAPTSRVGGCPGPRRWSEATPSSSSTARSSRAASPCSAPAVGRSRNGC